jgi:GDPmannose 4,6-dehydratase
MSLNKNKVALITGITGQDGSYLSEYLIELNYNIYGIVRRHSVCENQSTRIEHLLKDNKIKCFYGDINDISSLNEIIKKTQPDEVYNLAAQSHVQVSYEMPQFTCQTNSIGTLNILEACRINCPNAKIYQASTSEMFGNNIDNDGYQRETTPFNPVSPYACSKVFGHNLMINYRNAYNMKTYNGILFNHESPRRGINFVTNKVAKTAVEIKYGLKDKLYLGTLDSYRDWGHAKDYVRAMHMIVNGPKPDDYVVATGESHCIKELCEVVFKYLNMNYKDYVVQSEKYIRPEELKFLKGDYSKARKILNWQPKYKFKEMMHEMVDYWLEKLK